MPKVTTVLVITGFLGVCWSIAPAFGKDEHFAVMPGKIGASYHLALPNYKEGSYRWSSSNERVVSVSKDGGARYRKAGKSVVCATPKRPTAELGSIAMLDTHGKALPGSVAAKYGMTPRQTWSSKISRRLADSCVDITVGRARVPRPAT